MPFVKGGWGAGVVTMGPTMKWMQRRSNQHFHAAGFGKPELRERCVCTCPMPGEWTPMRAEFERKRSAARIRWIDRSVW